MKPGWYPDPDDENARRYWDGESWSAPLPMGRSEVSDAPALPNGGHRAPKRRRKVAWIISAAVVVVLVGAVAALLLVAKQSDDNDKRAAAQAASSSSAAASSSRAAAASQSSSVRASRVAAQREKNQLERTRRKYIVQDMEKTITKDARKDVADGLLDGPIKFTDCTPVGGGSTDILNDETGQFDCLAVTETHSDGTERGYNYSATVNWTKASYTWRLGAR